MRNLYWLFIDENSRFPFQELKWGALLVSIFLSVLGTIAILGVFIAIQQIFSIFCWFFTSVVATVVFLILLLYMYDEFSKL